MAADRFLDTEGLRLLWEKIKALFASVPEYTIEKLGSAETGYSSSYVLKKDNVQVGATINIPKDMVVSNGEVKTVTVADEPYQGAQVGDKYIDLTIANTSQNHIYIPVKDLVDVYVAGNGIDISQNNYISVKIDSGNANGLTVGGSGLALYQVTPSINGEGGSNGSMLATDKEKLDKLRLNSTEVILNGRSGSSGIQPWSLCAFAFDTSRFSTAIMYMTSFTATAGQGGGAAITGYAFPIGCKIYYHPDTTLFTASTDFTSKKFYSSYDDVDGRYSSNTGVSLSLSSSTSSSVYLRVEVDVESGYWRPYHKSGETYENIVTSDDFIADSFYIYLGKTVGSTGYKFQLEDNNPLYYYDGSSLIDWASYIAENVNQDLSTKADKVANATNGNFAGLDSNGNLTDSGKKARDFALLEYGISSITTQQDGSIVFTFANGNTTTVDLNHTHPNYYKKVVETTQPSGGMLPDVVYELGTLTGATTFSFAAAVSGNVNHYYFTFTSGTTAVVPTWPASITAWDGNCVDSDTGLPVIAASKTYEVSVLDGNAIIKEW